MKSKQCMAQNTSVGEMGMRLNLRVGKTGVGKMGVDKTGVGETGVGEMGIPLITIITLFQEDNIFGTDASLTYGPQIQRHT